MSESTAVMTQMIPLVAPSIAGAVVGKAVGKSMAEAEQGKQEPGYMISSRAALLDHTLIKAKNEIVFVRIHAHIRPNDPDSWVKDAPWN